MTIFYIPVSLWFVFFAALVSVVALILQAMDFRKKEREPKPTVLILTAVVTGLLILALFFGIMGAASQDRELIIKPQEEQSTSFILNP